MSGMFNSQRNAPRRDTTFQTRTLRAACAATFLLALTFMAGATPIAHASTINVTSIADTSGDPSICTLRDAIIAANTNAAAGGCPAGSAYPAVDTIWIQQGRQYCLFNPCTFILSSPLPQVIEPVIIHGATGCLCWTPTISGAYAYRVFDLAGVTVIIENVNIIRGSATGLGDAGYGGAIRTSSNGTVLTVSNVYFSENHAQTRGGAIYVPNGATVAVYNSSFVGNTVDSYGGAIDQIGGVLILSNSTLSSNSASDGGAIEVQSASDTRLTNVTISGNSARNNGGGISRIGTTYIFSMNNVTIAGNTADSDNNAFGDGGGIYRAGGTVTAANTIIAGNFDTPNNAGAGTIYPDCSWLNGGGLTSYGHNLIGRNDGCAFTDMGVGGDKVGTSASPINPLLGPLAYNGGPTATRALLPGSPAIDAGSSEVPGTLALGACVAADQRGVARPIGARCDIGAFEAPAYPQLFLPLIRR